ncbi:MAG: hypothetical protein JOZ97_07440 [Candidatus Eremiobacteraeota bacterium]|nr:hypothetical protein [Candidatus Eremiobacteraeota bacterium]
MMMQHLTNDQLIDYIHGALAPGEDAVVLGHLESCLLCADEYATEVRLSEMLREQAALEQREMPSTIKANIWQLIREAQPSYGARLRAWLRPAYLVPAAAVIALAAYFGPVYLGHHESPVLIDAAYYLQDHAAMNGSLPFGDRSEAAPAEFQANNSVAAEQPAAVAMPVA